jgi:hypothetical protein
MAKLTMRTPPMPKNKMAKIAPPKGAKPIAKITAFAIPKGKPLRGGKT